MAIGIYIAIAAWIVIVVLHAAFRQTITDVRAYERSVAEIVIPAVPLRYYGNLNIRDHKVQMKVDEGMVRRSYKSPQEVREYMIRTLKRRLVDELMKELPVKVESWEVCDNQFRSILTFEMSTKIAVINEEEI